MRSRFAKPNHILEMVTLAEEGFGRTDIAAFTGWSVQTVSKYVGHITPRRDQNRVPNFARYHRMLKAAASAEYGMRDDIAGRFGLAGRKSFDVTLVTARRRIAEADASPSSDPETGRSFGERV